MDLTGTIVSFLTTFELPAIFVGAFFFGETVIIAAAFLSAHGLWSPVNVFWLALAGTIVSDLLWFILGGRILTFFHRWDKYRERSEQMIRALDRLTGERPFLTLLFVKFLYGTRILTIIYLAARRMSLLTFVLFDAIGGVIWLAVILSLGWLAGAGVVNALPMFDKFEFAAVFLVLIIIIFRFFTKWISRKLAKE